MGESRTLRRDQMDALLKALQGAGCRVLGPLRKGDRVEIGELTPGNGPELDAVQASGAAKGAAFPRCEELLRYRTGQGEVEIEDRQPSGGPVVLLGVRPCEAASFDALEAVFGWDPPDRFFLERRERLTVISVACTRADEMCFCTSVGGGPGDTRGSDILLRPAGDRFVVEVVTEKGRLLADGPVASCLQTFGDEKPDALADVKARFDSQDVTRKLPALFDQPGLWLDQSLRCIGCGACAYVCPACVCFDIQDEPDGLYAGRRLRCWDSCGFGLFTLHASGHNPREVQSQRWRQRVMHKFSYYPDRFKTLGCVGCGKCSRACPADMNLAEHLGAIAEAQ